MGEGGGKKKEKKESQLLVFWNLLEKQEYDKNEYANVLSSHALSPLILQITAR